MEQRFGFASLAIKTIISHSLTYFLMGAIAAKVFNYAEMLARPNSGMRPMTSAWVIAGPMLQPIRGLIFEGVFYPLRDKLFGVTNGWLLMGWILFAPGILSTFGPAAGSIEGLIYTTTPVALQLRGWLEVVTQAFLFSALLCYWVNHPEKKWLSWLLAALFFIGMVLPILALLVAK